jgi:hypothetical protein
LDTFNHKEEAFERYENGECESASRKKVMTVEEAVSSIFEELRIAERNFPGFPIDPIHASAVLAEECGELQQACLQLTYEGGSIDHVRKEAVQTAAMAFRFLFHIDRYKIRPSEQEGHTVFGKIKQ